MSAGRLLDIRRARLSRRLRFPAVSLPFSVRLTPFDQPPGVVVPIVYPAPCLGFVDESGLNERVDQPLRITFPAGSIRNVFRVEFPDVSVRREVHRPPPKHV